MRKLNKKQVELLKQYPDVWAVDDLPYKIRQELESLNDYETLWQDANRFLWDQYLVGNPDHFFQSLW
jgi:hypothetical protein